jgi:hypothetical protein
MLVFSFILVTHVRKAIDSRLSLHELRSVPEFIDPDLGMKTSIFVKNSPKRSFSYQFLPRDALISMFWMRSDWGGGFQILELRRVRDQLVFKPKEQPY